ncbi:MAG: hypothetical protein EOO88_44050, partial [Pedobacter sp.]
MPYFDFHIHPTLKSMFTAFPEKTNPWEDIDIASINWVVRWCSDFEILLASQCNLSQLIDSGTSLACVALFVPERGFFDNELLKKQAVRTKLRRYLNPQRLGAMISGELKPYPDLVEEDLMVLFESDNGESQRRVIALNSGSEYDETKTDALYVVFTIEGCHTLSSSLNRDSINTSEVLNNLEALRIHYPILSLNLTHIERYPFCNHAYGILFVATDDFMPKAKGIAGQGIEIIKYCYEHEILIDVKHMSLWARRQLMQLRLAGEFGQSPPPLVCTHAGFTGINDEALPMYVSVSDNGDNESVKISLGKPKKYTDGLNWTTFNPSSINLFDEDIIEILISGGIIGLSLDKRILGYTEPDTQPGNMHELISEIEFVSAQELSLFTDEAIQGDRLEESYCITNHEVETATNPIGKTPDYHLAHFNSHLLHLMTVAKAHNYSIADALGQICIGSDFDGLINPIWCCENVKAMPAFKALFIDSFADFLVANDSMHLLPDSITVQL